jgi:predicted nucleotidyltransferase
LTSVVVKSINRPGIVEAVEAHATFLRQQNPEIERIIWFGSWINGLPVPGSDVDLCLVLSASDKPRHERITDYLPVGFPVGLDLWVYTQTEFEQLRRESPAWYQAIIAGREL